MFATFHVKKCHSIHILSVLLLVAQMHPVVQHLFTATELSRPILCSFVKIASHPRQGLQVVLISISPESSRNCTNADQLRIWPPFMLEENETHFSLVFLWLFNM